MTGRTRKTATISAYVSDNQLYAIGNGFSIEFRCPVQGLPTFKIKHERLRIDGYETAASLLAPFEFQSPDARLVAEDVDLSLLVKNGIIQFIEGYYSNLPVYSPYHVLTKQDDLYEVESQFAIPESPHVEGDELLNISPKNEASTTVRNVKSGWAGPVAIDRLRELFDKGRLQAAIPVEGRER